jgi:hypothetical protein
MPDNDEQQLDLAGYKTVEDLVKGYRNSSNEAKRITAERDAERTARMLLEQQTNGQRQSGSVRKSSEELLSEYGIPVDALEELIDRRANQRLTTALEPLARGATARNNMLSTYPDYQKYEADVAKFIEEDASLASSYTKMFSADPAAAMEFAFLKYGQKHSGRTGQSNGASEQQRQARAESQIPSNRSGDARTQPAIARDEGLSRSWEHYQKTGDPRAYARARLSQVISDDFLKT